MSAEKYKSILQRVMQCFNQGDLEGYLEIYHTDSALHFLPPGLPPGLAGARLFYSGFLAAFPDSQLSLDNFVIENDQAGMSFMLQATHQGEFMGIPATGKPITLQGITIMRFEGDKVIERWSQADFMGMMQQLGVIPAPSQQ